eukprot:328491_1
MSTSDKKKFTIRTRNFMSNRLLCRKQMVVEVTHPQRGTVPRKEMQAAVAKMYGIHDSQCVQLFGFKTAFGGGKSTGFALIYDNVSFCKQYEPKFRLVRAGLQPKKETARKQRRERKNRMKKVRGVKKAKATAKKGR